MDFYRAIGELIFMSLIGLSIFGVVVTLAFHFVLRPFLEKVLTEPRGREQLGEVPGRRLDRVERRLLELEDEVEKVRAARDFDRQLEG